ncbi:hypothetical protein JQN58_20545 [Aneurinibacillus sp. BA2021]|nr:hypothetical protein [Aneurinibacillus sp. BA2021]
MKRFVWTVVGICLMSVFLAGCTGTKAKGLPPEGTMRISPSSLFEGETKKLEPHLGLIAGAVKVQYQGPKNMVGSKYEIWENGKLKKSENILGVGFDTQRFTKEFSVSLREEKGESSGYAMTSVFSDRSGFSSAAVAIEGYRAAGWGPRALQEPIEVSDDKQPAVWGLIKGKGSEYIRTNESIEEMAKDAEWALVVKIFMKKE